MNIAKINEFRATLGLPAVTPRKDSKESQKRQRNNQLARAAADKAARDNRGRGKGK